MYASNIEYNIKNVIIILFTLFIVFYFSIFNTYNVYVFCGGISDYIMYFICGVVEVFSSIVPGISGTALFMILGMYEYILLLFSNMFNVNIEH